MDDFILNESELHKENETSKVGKAKADILKVVSKKIKEAEDNLNYSENSEFENNINIASRYLTAIMEINMMEADKSIEESVLLEKISKIEIRVKELSIEDLRKGDTDGDAPGIIIKDTDTKLDDNDFNF
jgi:hypothetical protein